MRALTPACRARIPSSRDQPSHAPLPPRDQEAFHQWVLGLRPWDHRMRWCRSRAVAAPASSCTADAASRRSPPLPTRSRRCQRSRRLAATSHGCCTRATTPTTSHRPGRWPGWARRPSRHRRASYHPLLLPLPLPRPLPPPSLLWGSPAPSRPYEAARRLRCAAHPWWARTSARTTRAAHG